jgi:ABC-type transport system involved in multi-copper enzyme maturation permease subunit
MIKLIRAEFAKLFSTKLWLWLLLGCFSFTALIVSVTIGTDGQVGNPNPRLSTDAGMGNLFASPSSAGVFSLILGAIGLTGEFRHQTVTPTFLATPHRGQVVIAKLVTYAIAGIAYGVITIGFALALALPWLSAKHIDFSLSSGSIPAILVGVATSVAVYAVLGVGVGALVRNQIAAIVGALIYLFLIENIASAVPGVRDYYKYFPGGANSALTHRFMPNIALLQPYQGGLVLVAYGLIFAVLGTWIAVRRDVT